jgi:hypothetical protein
MLPETQNLNELSTKCSRFNEYIRRLYVSEPGTMPGILCGLADPESWEKAPSGWNTLLRGHHSGDTSCDSQSREQVEWTYSLSLDYAGGVFWRLKTA